MHLMRFALVLLFSSLLLFGCGQKTGLVVYDDSVPLPTIGKLSIEQIQIGKDDVMHFTLDITGGSGAVAYQIDQGDVDSSCECITNWLRYYESSPSIHRSGLTRNIKLRNTNLSHAFRVRVVDSLGRKSVWSKVFRSHSESVLKPNLIEKP